MFGRGSVAPPCPETPKITCEEQAEILKIARERIEARKRLERHELAKMMVKGLDNRPSPRGYRRYVGAPNKVNLWMVLSDETVEAIHNDISTWESRHFDYDD